MSAVNWVVIGFNFAAILRCVGIIARKPDSIEGVLILIHGTALGLGLWEATK